MSHENLASFHIETFTLFEAGGNRRLSKTSSHMTEQVSRLPYYARFHILHQLLRIIDPQMNRNQFIAE
jgi:hypothetical protein